MTDLTEYLAGVKGRFTPDDEGWCDYDDRPYHANRDVQTLHAMVEAVLALADRLDAQDDEPWLYDADGCAETPVAEALRAALATVLDRKENER